jgi:hypothetical protein
MFIKQVVVEGVAGDVEITHVEQAARVTVGGRVICELRPTDNDDTRWAAAVVAAAKICGTDRRGRPNATNSMIHDVLRELKRVAGC